MSQLPQYTTKIDYLHIRMARAGLGMTIRELAALSGTNKATIVRIEAGKSVRDSTLLLVREILESKGAGFYTCEETQKVIVELSKWHIGLANIKGGK